MNGELFSDYLCAATHKPLVETNKLIPGRVPPEIVFVLAQQLNPLCFHFIKLAEAGIKAD
jgi:hypothetical protein